MKATVRRIAVALLPLMTASGLAADFDAAVAALDRGDYATAARELRPLAEQGTAVAQAALGAMYADGRGMTKAAGRRR